ncbi:uncharacterized protein LOC143277610 [Babylonia areolata]|uniref:uncharacterized protein LOC143277610 n=1 Tax=Babylonia areolata TaxID=304850 RepID=UPI003FD27CCD
MVTSISDTSEGVHDFTVSVTPGGGPVLAGSVTIKKPGEPRVQKASCPDVIAEGQDVRCKCRHTAATTPSPPALLTWVNASASSDVLELRNINGELSGRVHVCRSVWGPGGKVVSSVSYSPRVVYGPSKVMVTRDDDLDPENLTLTCRVQGEVSPSASFAWNVPCTSVNDTEVSSTCKLPWDQVDRNGNDVMLVECVATNSEFSTLNATATLTLSFPDTEEAKRAKPLPLALIVGIPSAVVGVVIVTVIIIIIAIRRKKRPTHPPKAVVYNRDEDSDDSEFQEYINDLYGTSMDLVTSSANRPVTVKPSGSAPQPQPDATYPSTSSAPAPTASSASAATRGSNVSSNSGQSGAAGEMAVAVVNVASGIPEGSGEGYTQVQKKTMKDKDAAPEADKVTEGENNVYAQVCKKKKAKAKAKAKGGEEEKPADETAHGRDQAEATNYEKWTSTGENLGNVGQLSCQMAAGLGDNDDEYHNLHFHRPSTEADDPLYNHLNRA